MAKIPIISGKTTVKTLGKLGYYIARKKGSHFRLLHNTKEPITIPDHKTIGKGLLKKILRDVHISVDDFIKLLKE